MDSKRLTAEEAEAELQKLLNVALEGWDIDGAMYTELMAAHERLAADRAALKQRVRELEARICDLSGALSPFANWWRLYLANQDTGSLGQPSDMRRAHRVLYNVDQPAARALADGEREQP